MNNIPEILKRLLEDEDIRVTCLRGIACHKGCCDAAITSDDGIFTLVTGIVMGADHLGNSTFTLKGIQKFDASSVTVVTERGDLMRLEPRT